MANRFQKYAQQSGVFIPDPTIAEEEARKRQDQANEQERLRLAQEAAARAADAQRINDQAAERAQREYDATHFADGTPKPKSAAPAAADPDRIPQIQAALANIRHIRDMAKSGTLAVGKLAGRVGDWPIVGPWLGQNRANIEGALQMVQGDLIQQQVARLSAMNGGKGVATMANSETEAARMAASVANLDPNQDLPNFLIGLQRAEDYYNRQLARLQPQGESRKPAADPQSPIASVSDANQNALGPVSELPTPWDNNPGDQPLTIASGNTRTIQHPEIRALVASMLNAGSSVEDINAELARRNSTPISPEQYATAKAWMASHPGQAYPINATEEAPLTLMQRAVNSPLASFAVQGVNAFDAGIPGALTGNRGRGTLEAMRSVNPVASTLGEIGGSVAGALAAGAGAARLAGKVANPTVARLLANPAAVDATFGATSGWTQADDPYQGAIIGALAGAGGNLIGSRVAKYAPRIVGLAPPNDVLTSGERRVLSAVDRTGRDKVATALAQGQELGVPVSLADVSSDVNSLTGAALRRSPSAAGMARDVLGQRIRGQYDRFLGAVERDLGPVENIPQRSEDLISQARTDAGPLYDAAYAAPGASAISDDIAPLLNRPSMRSALARARTIAAEEGRDPTTLGFDLDSEGNTVLTRVPSWQTLDYAKRGMDDVLEAFRDKTSGRLMLDEHGRAIDNTRRDFLRIIDAANPDYAAARGAYAGPAAEREAMRRGQDALRLSPNQLGVNIGNASPAQLEQMRLGLQSGLVENAGRLRNNSNPFLTLDTPAMEQRLGAMYGDNEVARLLAQRDLERDVASSTNRLIGNSLTAERQVADDAFTRDNLLGTMAQGALETAVTGAPVVTVARSGLGRGLGNTFRDWRTLGLGNKATALADEIAPITLSMEPGKAVSLMDDMAARDATYQAIVAELMKTAGVRGGHAGAGVSSGVAAALLNQ